MLRGDSKALEALYRQNVQLLFDYGMKITRDAMITEDGIQSLFTDIWEKRERLNTTMHVKAYLMLSLRRRLIRKLSNHQKKLSIDESTYQFSPEVDPESEWIDKESSDARLNQLNKALDQLNAQQKEILFLKYHRGLKSQEIAEILGIKDQSVRNALHRTIEKLKHLMISLLFVSTIASVWYSIIKGMF